MSKTSSGVTSGGSSAADGAHQLPRWAPKVSRGNIRRLYVLEALGVVDEDLVDDVGLALLARCHSIIAVTAAVRGTVRCPACGEEVRHDARPATILRCLTCGWSLPWPDYQKTFKKRQLFGGAALSCFEDFARRYPGLGDAQQRLLLIDWLIHEFHRNLTRHSSVPKPTRPTAANLIEGERLRDVLALLDELAHGGATDPDMCQSAAKWRENATTDSGM